MKLSVVAELGQNVLTNKTAYMVDTYILQIKHMVMFGNAAAAKKGPRNKEDW